MSARRYSPSLYVKKPAQVGRRATRPRLAMEPPPPLWGVGACLGRGAPPLQKGHRVLEATGKIIHDETA